MKNIINGERQSSIVIGTLTNMNEDLVLNHSENFNQKM